MEANPDLVKLNETGSKINNTIVSIEKLWKEMMVINDKQPKALRMYGKFQYHILNDEEVG